MHLLCSLKKVAQQASGSSETNKNEKKNSGRDSQNSEKFVLRKGSSILREKLEKEVSAKENSDGNTKRTVQFGHKNSVLTLTSKNVWIKCVYYINKIIFLNLLILRIILINVESKIAFQKAVTKNINYL